jgi:murein DD-endopeptidase MepM/ murein hydrolase activator NlpD
VGECYLKVGGGNFSIEETYIGTSGCGNKLKLNYDDHPGYDYKADVGTNVRSAGVGTVVNFNGQRCIPKGISSCANLGAIGIDHGNGYITQYLHMSVITKNAGDSVGDRESIGASGEVGSPGGPHLHFEVLKRFPGSSGTSLDDYRVVDPYGWMGACGDDPLFEVMGICSHKLWK